MLAACAPQKPEPASPTQIQSQIDNRKLPHSHSIVLGGFVEMS
jgi:hypothetical protein